MFDRRAAVVEGLDLAHQRGIEIGALDKPLISRADGPVLYVDYMDAPSLKMRWRHNPQIKPHRIEVDRVWRDKPLLEVMGPDAPLDYVVAAHVIEHAPNMIGWLAQIHDTLRDGGELRLVIPDKRFTFDTLRRVSSLPELVVAHLEKATKPTALCVLDCLLHAAEVSAAQAWLGDLNVKPGRSFTDAVEFARRVVEDGVDQDVHCWVFTPYSFADVMAHLAAEGWVQFACTSFHDTPVNSLEFFVTARRSANHAANAASWRHMRRQVRDLPGCPTTAATPSDMTKRVAQRLLLGGVRRPTTPTLSPH